MADEVYRQIRKGQESVVAEIIKKARSWCVHVEMRDDCQGIGVTRE